MSSANEDRTGLLGGEIDRARMAQGLEHKLPTDATDDESDYGSLDDFMDVDSEATSDGSPQDGLFSTPNAGSDVETEATPDESPCPKMGHSTVLPNPHAFDDRLVAKMGAPRPVMSAAALIAPRDADGIASSKKTIIEDRRKAHKERVRALKQKHKARTQELEGEAQQSADRASESERRALRGEAAAREAEDRAKSAHQQAAELQTRFEEARERAEQATRRAEDAERRAREAGERARRAEDEQIPTWAIIVFGPPVLVLGAAFWLLAAADEYRLQDEEARRDAEIMLAVENGVNALWHCFF